VSGAPDRLDPLREPVPEDVYGSWSPATSPDGSRVAFVSDRSGGPAVWIRTPRAGPVRVAGAPDRVLTVSWSPDGGWLACVAAAPGASRTQVWAMRPDGGDLRLLAGDGAATAVVGAGARQGWCADGRLLVTETDGSATALLVRPGDGARTVVATGPLLALLDVSGDARRALLRVGPRGDRSLAVVDLDGGTTSAPRPVHTGPGPGSVDRGCLAPDGRTVYARSDRGRELAALVAVDTTGTRPPAVLAARDDAELEDVVLTADGSRAVLLWNVHGGRSEVGMLDIASGRERPVTPLPRDVVDECRFTADGEGLLLTAEDWADPRGVWRVDVPADAAASSIPLSSTPDGELHASRGASAASVRTTGLTRPELHRLRSGDGLELTGWLYRPTGLAPWPAAVWLHGGPEAQERPVYDSLFQSLVAAGVAVFAPNVRGSSGFGRSFLMADDRERRPGAIADVAACVEHLVASGVADPARVGCMGRSYGGYLTLAALVEHPHLFAVGIDVCGMADFHTFYARTEPWIAAAAFNEYGHPEDDAALLRLLSPIHRIDRLRAPLLVVHGGQDTNVPVEESEQVVAALAARGVEHRYLLFEDEGHELLSTPNRVAFVRAAVDWTVRHLVRPAAPAPGGC